MTVTLSPARYALSVCAAAAILAGCGGGSTSPSYQPFGMSQTTRAQSLSSAVAVHDASCQGQRSFQYIGHAQRFEVPRCATTIYVDAKGASGEYGGDGGEVDATIPVTPRETLIVIVGGAGHKFNGGFNGGAAGAREIIRRGRYKGRYAWCWWWRRKRRTPGREHAGRPRCGSRRWRGRGQQRHRSRHRRKGRWPTGRRRWRNSRLQLRDSNRRWRRHAVLRRHGRSRKQRRLAGQRRRRCQFMPLPCHRSPDFAALFEQWRGRWLLRWRRGRCRWRRRWRVGLR